MNWKQMLLVIIAVCCIGQYRERPARKQKDEPMADPVWVSTNGNVSDPNSWSTGAIPVSGDRLIIDGTSQVDMINGLDLSSLTDMTWWFKSGYKGNVGSSGTPLQTGAATVFIQGGANIYLKGGIMTGYRINRSPSDNRIYIDGNIDYISVKNANIEIATTAVLFDSAKSALMIHTPGVKASVGIQMIIINDGSAEVDFTPVANVSGHPKSTTVYYSGDYIVMGMSDPATIFPGARVIFKPVSSVPAQSWLYVGGILDLSQNQFPWTLQRAFLGPYGRIIGALPDTTTIIDLREDMP